MKSLALLAIASLSIALPSCASDGHGWAGGGVASLGYDAYYDDAYGPFYDGYWGGDGAFYHRDHEGSPFVRDGGGHFRHGPTGGFHGVHTGGGHLGGGHAAGGR
jgi:hypothetical protein